jgi:hypothetical protein
MKLCCYLSSAGEVCEIVNNGFGHRTCVCVMALCLPLLYLRSVDIHTHNSVSFRQMILCPTRFMYLLTEICVAPLSHPKSRMEVTCLQCFFL